MDFKSESELSAHIQVLEDTVTEDHHHILELLAKIVVDVEALNPDGTSASILLPSDLNCHYHLCVTTSVVVAAACPPGHVGGAVRRSDAAICMHLPVISVQPWGAATTAPSAR